MATTAPGGQIFENTNAAQLMSLLESKRRPEYAIDGKQLETIFELHRAHIAGRVQTEFNRTVDQMLTPVMKQLQLARSIPPDSPFGQLLRRRVAPSPAAAAVMKSGTD